MSSHKAVVEHVPVVRHHADQPAADRVTVVFDAKTGRRIGHSPNVKVEQAECNSSRSGVITTTLKISPVKPPKDA